MSWLVIVKILPSIAVGDPPDRVAILTALAEEQLVGYEVLWGQKSIGSALIRGERTESGATMVEGQIRFEQLPIRRMLPETLLKLLGLDAAMPDDLQVYAGNHVLFHGNGRLQRFNSTVSLAQSLAAIRVEGFVVSEKLVLTIRSAGVTYQTRRPLPRDAMVSDGLMPQSRMPGLWEGRKWTVEVYSPLRPHSDPMEIMQAEVVGRDLITWGGQVENAWLVVHRGDPGGDVGRAGKEHAWLWVRDDGVVLQHRIAVLDGALTFVRAPSWRVDELEQQFGERKRPASGVVESDGHLFTPTVAGGETEIETEQP